jgi:hypothetical protein
MKTIFLIMFGCFLGALTGAQTNRVAPRELEFGRTHSPQAPTKKLRPVVLPDGRVVLSVADTVYMLDADGRQLWKFGTASANETLTSEPAFNAGRNEVAIVGNDLLFVRLDATTGKVKWKADTVGRATFASVTAYESGFLVVAEMSGYRSDKTSTSDRLEYWGASEEDSWSIAFPIGAELVVTGKKIYALRRGSGMLRVQELHSPTRKKIH